MGKLENDGQRSLLLKDMHIDTETASVNFSKQLLEHKTYFLNGEWGAGKTVFLKETQKASDKKFVYLNLWQVKDERSVMAIAFSKIHPIVSIIFKAIFITCVVISLLMTNIVNFGLTNIFNSKFFLIAGIIALFIAVWNFFKVKSDSFFNIAFKFKWLKISDKVLVIDDFDRVTPERQQQAYQLFNLLNSRMTIIFVGDYNNLANNTSKYLQKIVNRRVELPFVLHPTNIWHSYFKKLSQILESDISEKLIDVIISENRNLRERDHFNDFGERKISCVNA